MAESVAKSGELRQIIGLNLALCQPLAQARFVGKLRKTEQSAPQTHRRTLGEKHLVTVLHQQKIAGAFRNGLLRFFARIFCP